jgi:iron complex outermembrane receptor protein
LGLNGSADHATITGGYKASLFAKNLNDNRTIIQRPQIHTVIEGSTVRPPTFGLQLESAF